MSALISTNTSVVLLDFTSVSSPFLTLPSTILQHGRLLAFKNVSSNLSTQVCEIKTNGQDLFENNLSSFFFTTEQAHMNFVANSTLKRWLYLGGIQATAANVPFVTLSSLQASTTTIITTSYSNPNASTSVETLVYASSLNTISTITSLFQSSNSTTTIELFTHFLQPSSINQNYIQYPAHFSGRPTFSPSSLSQMSLWLDGAQVTSTPSTIELGTPLTYWFDKSGFTTEVSSIQDYYPIYDYSPTFKKAIPYFSTSPMFAKFPAAYTGTGITSFAVWSFPDLTFHENPVIYTLTRPNLYEYSDPQTFYGTVAISTVITAQRENILLQYDTFNVEEVGSIFLTATKFDDTTSLFNVNGISTTTNPSFCNLSMNVEITCVGGRTGNASYENHHGYIAELLVYFSSLTYSEIQKVEGYLAWKWGNNRKLPLTHPWYSIAP